MAKTKIPAQYFETHFSTKTEFWRHLPHHPPHRQTSQILAQPTHQKIITVMTMCLLSRSIKENAQRSIIGQNLQ